MTTLRGGGTRVEGGTRLAAKATVNGAAPLLGQRAPELQAWGTIARLPNGLDAQRLGPIVEDLNQIRRRHDHAPRPLQEVSLLAERIQPWRRALPK